jgi:endonuclease/exonuclease/phosphatase family metal-dependent hydrolase
MPVKISALSFVSALCALAVASGVASAQTSVTLNATETQVTDCTIGSGTAGGVVDNGAVLAVRTSTDVNATRRALLKFDTQNYVPANATIQSATLTVFVRNAAPGSRRFGAYEITQSFQETQANWTNRKTRYSWRVSGGSLGPKYAEGVVSSTVGSPATFDVTALVQARVKAGSSRYTRIALVDIDPADSTAFREFHSSEAPDAPLRPKLIVTYGGSIATPPPPPSTTTALRLVHWNLHHGVGTDGKYDLDRIATWVARLKPDVVSFNEVEKKTWWGNEDQPMRYKLLLEAKTGQTWYYVFAQEYGQWTSSGKGNMVLSRFPWTATARYLLSYSRTVALGQIVVNGRNITLSSTHLDPDYSSRRLTQTNQLMAWGGNFAENRIVAGDMNAQPTCTETITMKTAYTDAWAVAKAGAFAYSAPDNPYGYTRHSRIDYVFTSKAAANLTLSRVEVVDTRDANGVMPSDHRPILAVYDVK